MRLKSHCEWIPPLRNLRFHTFCFWESERLKLVWRLSTKPQAWVGKKKTRMRPYFLEILNLHFSSNDEKTTLDDWVSANATGTQISQNFISGSRPFSPLIGGKAQKRESEPGFWTFQNWENAEVPIADTPHKAGGFTVAMVNCGHVIEMELLENEELNTMAWMRDEGRLHVNNGDSLTQSTFRVKIMVLALLLTWRHCFLGKEVG